MEIGLEHLTKVFPGKGRKNKNKEVVAVNDFNFVISDGKLVGLLGPSGCGKSTTLNMISGLLKPSSGKIFFGDKDVTDLPPEERGVGMVFQNYALYPHMSVEQNIRFPLENLKGDQKLDAKQMSQRVEEAAKLVKIEGLLDRKPGELSGGQQQRVAIARALVKLPRVLLLDEPLSNLDARLRLQTREEIRRIQQKTGITTVFVTHDQDEAMSISDLIVVMKDGVLQQIDSPQKVYDDPANQFVAQFLGTPPITLYDGRIEQGKLWIGSDAVLNVDQSSDQSVIVGIRPEGYVLKDDGHLHNEFVRTEVMGRDMSVLSKNPASHAPFVRSILSTEHLHMLQGTQANFDLKPHKVFLFDIETGQRLRYPLTAIGESRDLE
ncbi:MAG: ABC transporter ATP-binding protein [Erysipelotrichaceae bacterium]|nr:ABC transporter ATP-binding protein [Erysipelotrichaceae bacterium]